eukprot:295515-Prorocentrum_lima.AAC.1
MSTSTHYGHYGEIPLFPVPEEHSRALRCVLRGPALEDEPGKTEFDHSGGSGWAARPEGGKE